MEICKWYFSNLLISNILIVPSFDPLAKIFESKDESKQLTALVCSYIVVNKNPLGFHPLKMVVFSFL